MATECDKKTKRACQSLKFWIHVLDREINIFKKFHVKKKVFIKSYIIVHEIRGTNIWDTLYTKVSRQRNMIFSSILTLFKINLSYGELSGPFLCVRVWFKIHLRFVWIQTYTFFFFISHRGYLLNNTLYKFLVSDFQ